MYWRVLNVKTSFHFRFEGIIAECILGINIDVDIYFVIIVQGFDAKLISTVNAHLMQIIRDVAKSVFMNNRKYFGNKK